MARDLAEALARQTVQLVSTGFRGIVIWGLNEVSLLVAQLLSNNGIASLTPVKIVDTSGAPLEPETLAHGCMIVGKNDLATCALEILVITADADKELQLREFAAIDQRRPQVVMSGVGHFRYSDPGFSAVLKSCIVRSYATGYPESLVHLYQAIQYLGHKRLRGAVAEFGMFRGGTTEFLVRALRSLDVEFTTVYGFDSFSGFPPRRSLFDLYSNPDCEFTNVEAVRHHASGLGIHVVEGDISETAKLLSSESLILSFFDTDNYSPTLAAITVCYERTVEGGILAFDHYHSEERFLYTLGERIAAHDALRDKPLLHLHGTGIFVKT